MMTGTLFLKKKKQCRNFSINQEVREIVYQSAKSIVEELYVCVCITNMKRKIIIRQ